MKNRYFFVLLLLISQKAFCQENSPGDYIFFSTGTMLKGKLESADEEKMVTQLENGASWPGQRDKFMIFFNRSGNYLTERTISRDPEVSRKQIQEFYGELGQSKVIYDVIIKAIPKDIIPCTVKNVLNGAINYLTTEGKSASINSDNVFAVIKANGSFEVFKDARDISEIADNLTAMAGDLKKVRTTTPENPSQTREQMVKQVVKPSASVAAENNSIDPKETATVKTELIPLRKKLSQEDQKIYQAKSIDKMQELASLLNDIVDSRRSRSEKDIAIQKALKMFIKGARVEVSAVNNTNSKTNRAVEEYLDRLSRLSYSKVNITYAELNFIEDFTPDTQGNFWGIASYVQTFETNKFRDLTPKTQKIKLEQYKKIVDGTTEEKFEILLGNISINVGQ